MRYTESITRILLLKIVVRLSALMLQLVQKKEHGMLPKRYRI